MKIGVIGLWHLGSVTAACLAKNSHHVHGYACNNYSSISLRSFL